MLGRKKQTKYENEFINYICDKGYFCQRTAGSGSGKHSYSDCILIMDLRVFLTEIKATKYDVFRVNGKNKKQLERMREVASRHQPLIPLLIIRWKNKRENKYSFIELNNLPKKVVYGECPIEAQIKGK
ncbi:MAG TPA: hypothetical protein VJH92_04220 [Candidatus Nanoarchaeia archaeon]|nr:hypothetical protein [Candidatus Nanoarchaeia archaeon]